MREITDPNRCHTCGRRWQKGDKGWVETVADSLVRVETRLVFKLTCPDCLSPEEHAVYEAWKAQQPEAVPAP